MGFLLWGVLTAFVCTVLGAGWGWYTGGAAGCFKACRDAAVFGCTTPGLCEVAGRGPAVCFAP